MLFATDLDNTMIFSNRRIVGSKCDVHCVEYYNGLPITYMTHSSIAKLNNIVRRINVVPITTRSLAQFNRIQFFSELPLAVVANGGTILQNGKVYKEWEHHINGILKKYDFEYVLEIFSTLPGLSLKPKLVDGKFVFAKSNDADLCRHILQSKLDTKIWQLSFQRKKIYAIPMEITKGNALRFICEHIVPDNLLVVSAGDSNLDISMLEYSDYAIIPSDCSLSLPEHKNLIKLGNGVYTSDAILDFVFTLSF